MAFQNIALSGRIACGSSTLASALSQNLGWSLRDGSQIFRDISAHLGYDLERAPQQYNDDVDRKVDEETYALLALPQQIVVSSKLAGFLSRDIPHTLRVLLICSQEERIRRYIQSRGHAPKEAPNLIQLREQADQKKWERLHGPNDFFDQSFFHLVLDSGSLSIKQEVAHIITALAGNQTS